MSADQISLTRNDYTRLWGEALAEIFTRTAGETVRFAISDAAQELDSSESLSFDVSFSGAINGTLQLGMTKPAAALFARRLTRQPIETEAQFDESSEAAVLAWIDQAAADVTRKLRARCGELSSNLRRSSAPLESEHPAALQLEAAPSPVVILLRISDALLRPAAPRPSGPSEAASGALNSMPASASNLKLIMDVPLNVTLRFGRRQLPLSEVLELATGSVIELDREVEDPVELFLGDRVIARGEVVIVNGNYGLRVTNALPVTD